MSRPLCPRHRVPLHDDGRCRACWERKTGRCASHGDPLHACPRCIATRSSDASARQRRLRTLLGIKETRR